MRHTFLLATFTAVLMQTTAGFAQQASDTVAPEKATAITSAKRVEAKSFMVAAANPLAAEAGRAIIEKGWQRDRRTGGGADGAGLPAEPQSSGLGGGASLSITMRHPRA